MKPEHLQDFKNAWQWHIDQIASLALAADMEYEDFISVKRTLETWLKIAVKRTHDNV